VKIPKTERPSKNKAKAKIDGINRYNTIFL
jgi:hypothetical protein